MENEMTKFSLNHIYKCAGLGGIGEIQIPCNIVTTFTASDGLRYAVIEREAYEGSLSLFFTLESQVSYNAAPDRTRDQARSVEGMVDIPDDWICVGCGETFGEWSHSITEDDLCSNEDSRSEMIGEIECNNCGSQEWEAPVNIVLSDVSQNVPPQNASDRSDS
jgi:hypothetical protein